jgi:hypothetical protein
VTPGLAAKDKGRGCHDRMSTGHKANRDDQGSTEAQNGKVSRDIDSLRLAPIAEISGRER